MHFDIAHDTFEQRVQQVGDLVPGAVQSGYGCLHGMGVPQLLRCLTAAFDWEQLLQHQQQHQQRWTHGWTVRLRKDYTQDSDNSDKRLGQAERRLGKTRTQTRTSRTPDSDKPDTDSDKPETDSDKPDTDSDKPDTVSDKPDNSDSPAMRPSLLMLLLVLQQLLPVEGGSQAAKELRNPHAMQTAIAGLNSTRDQVTYLLDSLPQRYSCKQIKRYFPMDEQICPLIFGSYGYPSSDILYRWKQAIERSPVVISTNVTLSQFNLTTSPEVSTSFSNHQARKFFSFIRVLSPGPAHWILYIQVYLPCSLLVVLSWVSFWINREATADRVSLGITAVLTLTTLCHDSRQDLPRVATQPH
uniref:Neur_chan_LBD domain-containing protein n=1 Tax=Macrostomum lignano TaxID=282301 RepID=A0A1I8F8U2_9PLAT